MILRLGFEKARAQRFNISPSSSPLTDGTISAMNGAKEGIWSLNGQKEIWVLAEPGQGRPVEATFELLAKANALAAARGSKIAVLLFGCGVSSWTKAFEGWGVSKVYLLDKEELSSFHEEPLAKAIAAAARKYGPETILGPATVKGRSLLPRLAVLLETGLTADCTSLEIDEKTGKLLQTRPAFGGNLLATIVSETLPQMSTVRPHVFSKECKTPIKVEGGIEVVDISKLGWSGAMKKVLSAKSFGSGSASLADADAIVGVGMGIGGPRGVELAKALADKLGAALAASRSVVDSGWLEYSRQVGQTGLTVHPKTYIACGISGAIQHLVGMQDSEFIIAINRDPEAAIFSVADVAICGDAAEILPALIAKL